MDAEKTINYFVNMARIQRAINSVVAELEDRDTEVSEAA